MRLADLRRQQRMIDAAQVITAYQDKGSVQFHRQIENEFFFIQRNEQQSLSAPSMIRGFSGANRL